MNKPDFRQRKRVYLPTAFAALAGLLLFWACHLNDGAAETRFDVKPDSAWIHCDSLLVELRDTDDKIVDTLFNDTLKSLDQLKALDASKYKGGRAVIYVLGKKKDGSICAEQSRSFDDKGGTVTVDTVSEPGAEPKSVTLDPSTSLSLNEGDAAVTLKADLNPKFAEQLFIWSVDDASVASLDLPKGPNASEALVIPLKNGTAHVRVQAKRDTSISAVLVIQVGSTGGKSISLVPDSLDLFLGGPDSVLNASTEPEAKAGEIAWSSSDEAVVKVDDQGRVKAVKVGSADIEARYFLSKAKARIRVKRDVPVLTVSGKSGAAVNAPIFFSPKATQEFGTIVMFKFDLDGDSTWDDSLPGPFLGTNVDLPPQTATFSKEGSYKLHFLVRDSEGNEATATVSVDIGNQPPEVVAKSNDTLVTINDFVNLEAKVRDAEGKVALLGWDYDGDGKLDDSVKANDSVASIKGGHKYAAPGKFTAILYAIDDAGKIGKDSVRIEVVLDPPTADIGPDISVIAGSSVAFSVKGTDKFGTIAKREIKVGSGSFLNLSKQDTALVVPGDSGKVTVVGRVTDDDGNSAVDSMVVTLLPPTKSNNDLTSLIASAGVLAPAFKPVTVAYSLAVGYGDSLVSVTALTTDPAATLLVNGKPVAPGKPADSVAVPVGTTQKAFEIVVTAQDGNQKSYSIAVTRAPSADAGLANLEPVGFALKPAFKPDLFEYADTVAFKVASVTVKPTSIHPAAKILVNDTAVISGSASKALALDVGDNLIRINVTAQDGKTKSLYTVKLVRRAKVLVSRVVGADSAKVDSLEAPLGAVVSLKAPDSTGFHFTKWALTEGTGTFQDSAVNPAKLTVKSATVRATAAFAINVYTITGTIKGFVGGAFDHASIQIQHGKDTSITVTPLVGYRVLSVTDSGAPLAALSSASKFGAKTFKLAKVTKNHTLEATFLKTYTVAVTANAGGTVSPQGTTELDSNATFELALTVSSTHFWINTFTDNGADSVAFVSGDRMATSKYIIANLTANHALNVGFALRTFQLTVVGKKVSVCPTGQLCLVACPIFTGCTPAPDSLTTTVEYGVSNNIYTDTAGVGPFSTWCGSPAMVTNANPGTVTLTAGDGKYTAKFNGATCTIIIPCCPSGICCHIIPPPIGTQSTIDQQSIAPLGTSP
jgi:hypothetical protein